MQLWTHEVFNLETDKSLLKQDNRTTSRPVTWTDRFLRFTINIDLLIQWVLLVIALGNRPLFLWTSFLLYKGQSFRCNFLKDNIISNGFNNLTSRLLKRENLVLQHKLPLTILNAIWQVHKEECSLPKRRNKFRTYRTQTINSLGVVTAKK